MKTLLFIPFLFMCSMVIGQSSKIIGTPIKIGKLEVAEYDFPKTMKWNDAKIACAKLLGGGVWRLPTKDELNLMYQYKDEIGGFSSNNTYWSSSETDNGGRWTQSFDYGWQSSGFIFGTASVRAVRSL